MRWIVYACQTYIVKLLQNQSNHNDNNNNNLTNFHKSHENHSGPMFSTELYTSLKIIEKETLQMASIPR